MRTRIRLFAAVALLAGAVGVWLWASNESPASPPDERVVIVKAPEIPALPPPAPLQAASLGVSAIEVIVSRNDTLDQIFRRLKLDLADLSSLRNLPGLKARLDRLRPGEVLQFLYRDGSLFGFQ